MAEGRSIGREHGSQRRMGSGRVAAVAASGDDDIEVAAAASAAAVTVASSSGQLDDANCGAQQVNVLSRMILSLFGFPF
jgi:hypothetical protein